MNASIREQILHAVVAALQGLENVLPQNVFRSRVLPISREMTPAIVVMPESESHESLMNSGADRVLTLNVEIYTRGDIPDQLADEILMEVDGTMLTDTHWDDLAVDTRPATEAINWDFADADQQGCRVTLRYEIHYRTLRLDQSQVY